MPRQEIIVQVFVGSPGDVVAEREALESIVTELNKTWSRSLGLRLDLIRWETDTYPGFGSDPQDVINKQIGDNYDVFIGIFWGRVGTETGRAASGTIEEFQRAKRMHAENSDSIDILLYFKDEPLAPSKIDPDQLANLQKFKSSLGKKGGFYWEFETLADFEATLRSHLSAIAQKWAKKSNVKSTAEESVNENYSMETSIDEEYGFLDYLEAFDDLNLEMCQALNHMSDATNKIGESMDKRTNSMNEIGDVNSKSKISEAKKIIKLSAEDMDRYANVLNIQLPILSTSRAGALDALSNALVVYRDFDTNINDLNEMNENITLMTDAALGSKISLNQFKETILNLPRITSQFNRSKRNAAYSLENVLKELSATIRTTQNISNAIVELKAELTTTDSEADTRH